MLTQFFSWYLAVQLVSLAALPLTLTTFANLPDRGYAFSKSLGIFLVGFTLWLGHELRPPAQRSRRRVARRRNRGGGERD